jgi:hypothetical protein
MATRLLGSFLVLLFLAAGLRAADNPVGVVVSYDKDTMKLVVKVGDKERTLQLTAKTHVHDVDDSEIKVKDRPDKLKKGTKIDIEEKNGKLVEINLKK